MTEERDFPGAHATGEGYAFNTRQAAEEFAVEFGIDSDAIESRGVAFYIADNAARITSFRRFDGDIEPGFGETDRLGRPRSERAILADMTGLPSSEFVDAHPAIPPSSQPVPASETLRGPGNRRVVGGTVVDDAGTTRVVSDDNE